VFLVVSYDIADDKRRLKVAKCLEDYLTRVQYSVFEGELPEKQCAKMLKELKSRMNPEEDSIRVYRLCESCVHNVSIMGTGVLTKDPDVYII